MLQRGHAVDGARAHIDESRRPVLFLFSARRGTLLGSGRFDDAAPEV